MSQHVKVLGILHIILGALGALGALVVFLIFGGAAAVMTMDRGLDPDTRIAVPIIGALGTAIPLFMLVLSLPGIIIGAGLVRFRSWARVAGIVLSAFSLLAVPLGTILGIYGLWVLLQSETEAVFQQQALAQPFPR